MLAVLASHAPIGVDGQMVSVEVDIRHGLPGIDIVGLPDGAVRESRERVRVAIRNSGFTFPPERILVSLAPAAIRKEGASFDLPIALGVLLASGQIGPDGAGGTMVLGELDLGGAVRPVNGVLSAVGSGLSAGIDRFLVPRENLREALALGQGRILGIASLRQAALALSGTLAQGGPVGGDEGGGGESAVAAGRAGLEMESIGDIRGHAGLKRALEIAAAGRHNLLLFGPPGKRQDNGGAAAAVAAAGPRPGRVTRGDADPFHRGRAAPGCRAGRRDRRSACPITPPRARVSWAGEG